MCHSARGISPERLWGQVQPGSVRAKARLQLLRSWGGQTLLGTPPGPLTFLININLHVSKTIFWGF